MDHDSLVGVDKIDAGTESDDDDFRPEEKMTAQEIILDRRSQDRIERANVNDQKLMSKYLPRTNNPPEQYQDPTMPLTPHHGLCKP
jgi:hypothetical protein